MSLLPEPDIKARLAAVLDMLTNAEFRQEDFQGCFSEGACFPQVPCVSSKLSKLLAMGLMFFFPLIVHRSLFVADSTRENVHGR